MKYLVVCSNAGAQEKTLCADEKDAIELVEAKLCDGCEEADLEVYAAESISFNVARVPVVTLGEETAEVKDAAAGSSQPDVSDYPSASFSSYTTDEKSEAVNPFSTEQVFSLDS